MLSASQEIEMNADNPAAIQTVVLQRDDLQNGLLSTCRELSRATAVSNRFFLVRVTEILCGSFFFLFSYLCFYIIALTLGLFFTITKNNLLLIKIKGDLFSDVK